MIETESGISTVGQYLKSWRQAHHLSLRQLAHLCGVSHPTLFRMEKDDLRVQLKTWMKVAEVMGMTFQISFGYEEEK